MELAAGERASARLSSAMPISWSVGSNCQNLDGSGQIVGIVGFDVFNKSDVDAYDALQLPPITDNAKVVATEGGNPTSGANVEGNARR